MKEKYKMAIAALSLVLIIFFVLSGTNLKPKTEKVKAETTTFNTLEELKAREQEQIEQHREYNNQGDAEDDDNGFFSSVFRSKEDREAAYEELPEEQTTVEIIYPEEMDGYEYTPGQYAMRAEEVDDHTTNDQTITEETEDSKTTTKKNTTTRTTTKKTTTTTKKKWSLFNNDKTTTTTKKNTTTKATTKNNDTKSTTTATTKATTQSNNTEPTTRATTTTTTQAPTTTTTKKATTTTTKKATTTTKKSTTTTKSTTVATTKLIKQKVNGVEYYVYYATVQHYWENSCQVSYDGIQQGHQYYVMFKDPYTNEVRIKQSDIREGSRLKMLFKEKGPNADGNWLCSPDKIIVDKK